MTSLFNIFSIKVTTVSNCARKMTFSELLRTVNKSGGVLHISRWDRLDFERIWKNKPDDGTKGLYGEGKYLCHKHNLMKQSPMISWCKNSNTVK